MKSAHSRLVGDGDKGMENIPHRWEPLHFQNPGGRREHGMFKEERYPVELEWGRQRPRREETEKRVPGCQEICGPSWTETGGVGTQLGAEPRGQHGVWEGL